MRQPAGFGARRASDHWLSDFAERRGVSPPVDFMRVLFIGDIVGPAGVSFLRQALPALVTREHIDLVIANAENAAGGSGLTSGIYKKLRDCGIDLMTLGGVACISAAAECEQSRRQHRPKVHTWQCDRTLNVWWPRRVARSGHDRVTIASRSGNDLQTRQRHTQLRCGEMGRLAALVACRGASVVVVFELVTNRQDGHF